MSSSSAPRPMTRVVPLTTSGLATHSSRPWVLSLALKNRRPFTFVSPCGEEAPLWLISPTRELPADVPSLCHSSWPCEPSLALNNRVPLTFVSPCGEEAPLWLMSRTREVPADVPLLFH